MGLEKVVEYLSENFGFEGYRGGKVILAGTKTASLKLFLKKNGVHEILPEEFGDLSLYVEVMSCINSPKKHAELLNYLEENYNLDKQEQEEKQTKADSFGIGDTSNSLQELIKDLVPVTLIDSKEPCFYNSRTRTIYSVENPNPALNQMGLTKKDVLENPKFFKTVAFDPFNHNDIVVAEVLGKKVNCLNVAPRLEWLAMDVEPVIPPFIQNLLNHLFPNQEDQNYVLDWTRNTLERRSDICLVLAGSKGVGKNVFFQILQKLHGREMVEVVGQSFLDEKFNSQMKNKRLLLLDEVNFEESKSKNTIKRVLNDFIPIEAKGVDAKVYKNTCSMIITTNDVISLGIEHDDRRFATPEISSIPLKKVISEKEIAKRISDPDGELFTKEVAQFGHFLKNRVVEYSSTEPLKNKYFYKIADHSLPVWFSSLLGYMETNAVVGKPCLLKDATRGLSSDGSAPKIRTSTFEQRVLNYKYLGEHSIGSVIETTDKNGRKAVGIMPNPDFLEAIRQERQKKIESGQLIVEKSQAGFVKRSESHKPQEDGDLL